MKEEAGFNAETTTRETKFSGADKSTRRNSPRQGQEREERTDDHYDSQKGCLMCFTLSHPRYGTHIPEKGWFKDKYDKLMQDPMA